MSSFVERETTVNDPGRITRALEEACRRQTNNVVAKEISPEPRGSNVFLGIGLLTQRGISAGLGFGVIPMACLATDVQRALRDEGLDPRITVLVADQHARDALPDRKDVARVNKVAANIEKTVHRLFGFLGTTVTVLKASSDAWPSDATGYVAMETADMLHAHEKLGCGVKIGWQSKRTTTNPQTTIRDERWFDEQAKAVLAEKIKGMSFLRTPEWISIRTRLDPAGLPTNSMRTFEVFRRVPYGSVEVVRKRASVNTSPQHLPLPPYIGERGFHLGCHVTVRDMVTRGEITRVMGKALAECNGTLRRMLGVRERTEPFAILQGLIDTCVDET